MLTSTYAYVQSCAGWNFVSAPAPQNLNRSAPAGVWEILPAPAPAHF